MNINFSKKENNELGSNNKFLSKTKRIINNPIKENEAKLANLPLNYNYSSDSTNDLNQSKNKENNNEIFQKNNNNYNVIVIKNRQNIDNIDINYRSKSRNPIRKNSVNLNENISSKKQYYGISPDNKNKNCNIKGRTGYIFYQKCNSSKNIIQNKNANNILTYQIDGKKGYQEDILYNKNIIGNCFNNRRINENLIKEELDNYGKDLEEIKYKNEINNLKKKHQ